MKVTIRLLECQNCFPICSVESETIIKEMKDDEQNEPQIPSR